MTATFKDYLKERIVPNGNKGYFETFIMHSKHYKSLIKEIEKFITASKNTASDEGLSHYQQREMIIDDIVSQLYRDLGGK